MKKYALFLLITSSLILAGPFAVNVGQDIPDEATIILTPRAITELLATQDLVEDAEIGSFELRDVELGFDLKIQKQFSLGFNLELEWDVEDRYFVGVNNAYFAYAPNDVFTLTTGLLTNHFAMREFNALSYPLIYDDLEMVIPAVKADLQGEVLFGGLTMYQGMYTDNFLSFGAVFGVNLAEKAFVKASSRTEFEDGGESFTDISFGVKVTPIDFLELHSEFITELNEKSYVIDSLTTEKSKMLGYYAEAAFFVGEKWILAARYDERIEHIGASSHTRAGERAIEGSCTFQFIEPLSVSLGVTGLNSYAQNVDAWTPQLKLLASFATPW